VQEHEAELQRLNEEATRRKRELSEAIRRHEEKSIERLMQQRVCVSDFMHLYFPTVDDPRDLLAPVLSADN